MNLNCNNNTANVNEEFSCSLDIYSTDNHASVYIDYGNSQNEFFNLTLPGLIISMFILAKSYSLKFISNKKEYSSVDGPMPNLDLTSLKNARNQLNLNNGNNLLINAGFKTDSLFCGFEIYAANPGYVYIDVNI